jgi:hypothetical protein
LASSTATGWGLTFRIPVKANRAWTIKVRGGATNCTATHTAQLLDGATPSASTTVVSSNTTPVYATVTTTVTPSVDCELYYRISATSANSSVSSTDIRISSITVAGSY